jgi:hypothetical protein
MGRKGHARKLARQYVCSQQFSEISLTLADETCLDCLAVPKLYAAVSHPDSVQPS